MGHEYLKRTERPSIEISDEVTEAVDDILSAVRERGDHAVREFTERFDGVDRESIRVTEAEIEAAREGISDADRETIDQIVENVRAFHEEQRDHIEGFEAEIHPGVRMGQRVVPVESAGVYIPGGRYPLVASPAMTIVPAVIAGVDRIVACAPPTDEGGIQPAQLYAMDTAGADEIHCVGGAQAVGAMAYGTERAEHDADSRPVLLTTDETLARETMAELDAQLPDLRTEEVARECWNRNGEVVVADTMAEAVDLTNDYAMEHLQVLTEEPRALMDDLHNYGSLFLGEGSPVVFGDKSAGTNHSLPTLEISTYSGGIWVGTYLKVLTHQEATPEGAARLADHAAAVCEIEGTHAHQRSAEARRRDDENE